MNSSFFNGGDRGWGWGTGQKKSEKIDTRKIVVTIVTIVKFELKLKCPKVADRMAKTVQTLQIRLLLQTALFGAVWSGSTLFAQTYLSKHLISSSWSVNWQNQQNDCGSAKTQISLAIHPVWSESSLCAQLIAKDSTFLHTDSEDWSDWADAQADLSLCWANMPFCWFCHEVAHMNVELFIKSKHKIDV